VSLGVDHRDPPRQPDLVRGQTDPTGCVHRLEHVVDDPPNLVVDLGHLGAPLAKHGGAEEVKLEQAHPVCAGALV
jgi:hypothetical protein